MKISNLSRKEKVLFVTPVLALAVPILYWFRSGGDMLDMAQRELAGADAINCGIGRIEMLENNGVFENRAQVDACAVAAFKAKKPFLARYDTELDGESNLSRGVAGTQQGRIYFFYYSYYYYSLSSILWRGREYDYRRILCPEPKLIMHTSLQYQKWQKLGCSTCPNSDCL